MVVDLRGAALRRARRPLVVSQDDPAQGPVLLATMLRRPTTVGVSTHMTQVLDVLHNRGVLAEVVRPDWPAPGLEAAILGPGMVLRRVTTSEAAVRLDRSTHRHVLQAALRRRFRAGRPRAVYAQDPRSAAAALRVRGDDRVPVVMVVHYNESQAQELIDGGRIKAGGTADRRIRQLEAEVLPKVDGLVYVSRYMKQHVESAIPAAADVPSVVVPNFLEDDDERGTAAGPEVPAGDCITVGSLVERKNHSYLLRVLAAGRRTGHVPSLTIVGDGPCRAQLEDQARTLGVADQVLFTGSRSDVSVLLRQHRVYVHSASMENLPYALLEAFRAGLPVVAGRVGGIGEIIGEPEEAGRFWPLDDAAAGARTLNALLTDPVELARASRRARQLFEERYSSAAAGNALADFLLTTTAR